jgi:serine/threonine protein phosphatase PrpC
MGGCVGTVAWFHQERAFLFHLGDSECWISTRQGQAEKMTETHSFGQTLTRFYGSVHDPSNQTASFDFSPGMRLLLTSDGLRNAGLVEAMMDLVEGRRPPRQAVEMICAAAVSGGLTTMSRLFWSYDGFRGLHVVCRRAAADSLKVQCRKGRDGRPGVV